MANARLPRVFSDCFIRLSSGLGCGERQFAQKVLKNLKLVVWRKLCCVFCFSLFLLLCFRSVSRSRGVSGLEEILDWRWGRIFMCVIYCMEIIQPPHTIRWKPFKAWFFLSSCVGYGLIKNPLRIKSFLICEPSLTMEAATAHPSYGLDQGRGAAMTDTAHCSKDKYMD